MSPFLTRVGFYTNVEDVRCSVMASYTSYGATYNPQNVSGVSSYPSGYGYHSSAQMYRPPTNSTTTISSLTPSTPAVPTSASSTTTAVPTSASTTTANTTANTTSETTTETSPSKPNVWTQNYSHTKLVIWIVVTLVLVAGFIVAWYFVIYNRPAGADEITNVPTPAEDPELMNNTWPVQPPLTGPAPF